MIVHVVLFWNLFFFPCIADNESCTAATAKVLLLVFVPCRSVEGPTFGLGVLQTFKYAVQLLRIVECLLRDISGVNIQLTLRTRNPAAAMAAKSTSVIHGPGAALVLTRQRQSEGKEGTIFRKMAGMLIAVSLTCSQPWLSVSESTSFNDE